LIEYAFAKSILSDEHDAMLEKVLEQYFKEFDEAIKEAKWLDEKTRAEALEKRSKIRY
jgi:predicted metalloendopeptidase